MMYRMPGGVSFSSRKEAEAEMTFEDPSLPTWAGSQCPDFMTGTTVFCTFIDTEALGYHGAE